MKLLVESVGPYEYMLPYGEYLECHRPNVVQSSGYMSSLISNDKVKLVTKLHDTALDDDIIEIYRDEDKDSRQEELSAYLEVHAVGKDEVKTAITTERQELEKQANELGINFNPRIGDEKLKARVEEALKAKED